MFLMAKSELHYEAPFDKKISRLFIFRFLWMFPLMIIFIPWAIAIEILMLLQCLHMLILGKRCEFIWKAMYRLMKTSNKWNAYFSTLIDKRPKFIEDL